MAHKHPVTINGTDIVIRVPMYLRNELVSAIDLVFSALPSDKNASSLSKNEKQLLDIFDQISRLGFEDE
jgi:hypothetical protein